MNSGGRGCDDGRGFQRQQRYGEQTHQPAFGQDAMESDTTVGPFK